MSKKKLAVLGSTGSIGVSTLDIAKEFSDVFDIQALSCKNRAQDLAQQIKVFSPKMVCVGDVSQKDWLQKELGNQAPQIYWGDEGLVEMTTNCGADVVMAGIVGAAGLRSTYAAISEGIDVALANKETMVLAGELILQKAKESGSKILPADSEHNAIFQSLVGHRHEDIEKLILTASGGPFRDRALEDFSTITLQEALNHPNWEMGPKITIDSATMMNKGLEVIEARWLFDIPVEQIEVLIHRESIIHSMVEYQDGSFVAQLGLPDMRTPIAYCLSYPERLPLSHPKMNLAEIGKLQFQEVSNEKFPCLELAMKAAQLGGAAPAILNGANEAVVAAYLEERLHFTDIAKILNDTLHRFCHLSDSEREQFPCLRDIQDIDDALEADHWGRQTANSLIK